MADTDKMETKQYLTDDEDFKEDLTDEEVNGLRHRRGRSSSRPSYKIPSKARVKRRSENGSQKPEDLLLSERRDLSPSEVVREYLAKADEKIDNVIERIVHRVQEQAELAAEKSSELVLATSDIVHNVVHNVHERAEVAAQRSSNIVQQAVRKIRIWRACHFDKLPAWMKDNEHLHFGHRPQLHTFAECFKSIFRIHTETGNIWTHMIGFFAFLIATIVFYVKPFCDNCHQDINFSEKLIFLCFFIGAMLCLLCSTLFHTVACHSEHVSNLFSRLDYIGIAFLIMGSAVTWLYYGFYCEFYAKLTYTIAIVVLGTLTAIITMWEKFNLPDFRVWRALLFVLLGLVSATPIIHFIIKNGLKVSVSYGALYHMILMGALYVAGAGLYAFRIPERFFPGKCDIWFQSHQLFHLLVVIAAFIHYHGVIEMARLRLTSVPACPIQKASF